MMGHLCAPKRGNLRIEVKFAKELKQMINALVYMEFDNLIQIDQNRNVIRDY